MKGPRETGPPSHHFHGRSMSSTGYKIAGALDGMNAAVRRLTLQGLMFGDVHKLTVDLSDLEDVSSAGLQFMLRYKGCKK